MFGRACPRAGRRCPLCAQSAQADREHATGISMCPARAKPGDRIVQAVEQQRRRPGLAAGIGPERLTDIPASLERSSYRQAQLNGGVGRTSTVAVPIRPRPRRQSRAALSATALAVGMPSHGTRVLRSRNLAFGETEVITIDGHGRAPRVRRAGCRRRGERGRSRTPGRRLACGRGGPAW